MNTVNDPARDSSVILRTAVAIALLAFTATHAPAQTASQEITRRVQFRIITTVSEGDTQELLSEALVDGPPGTDFDLHLRGSRFEMEAKFMTDLKGKTLQLRATLETRRLYGVSERGLPLYEEDVQKHTIKVGFDETAVLLPFGGAPGDDGLRVEIEPSLLDEPASDEEERPLNIEILKQSPGGAIGVHARKIPHYYDVDAQLVDEQEIVARAQGTALLERELETTFRSLHPGGPMAADGMVLRLTVDKYSQSSDGDLVTFQFDLDRNDSTPAARNWAGVALVGAPSTYQLSDLNLELKLRISLARE